MKVYQIYVTHGLYGQSRKNLFVTDSFQYAVNWTNRYETFLEKWREFYNDCYHQIKFGNKTRQEIYNNRGSKFLQLHDVEIIELEFRSKISESNSKYDMNVDKQSFLTSRGFGINPDQSDGRKERQPVLKTIYESATTYAEKYKVSYYVKLEKYQPTFEIVKSVEIPDLKNARVTYSFNQNTKMLSILVKYYFDYTLKDVKGSDIKIEYFEHNKPEIKYLENE